ncbi:MAG: DUF418 domain-containing protein [Bacteroides sp.]|uniref:DUF418 domain-containing protein n=1 Tax=Bacteroides sp. TaxID=29523 RepID=UPI001B6515F5|nr:DUF418 domain-containing protein [Bacteroides sp.]MBP9587099.1 DUF418 domain-containing protein [Bacteroides sp.]
MKEKIADSNARVDVADVLRGLAVMGIIVLHSIEHFNFYSFPESVPFEWMKFTDQAIWRGLFFAFGGKAYAVFALLFGFSFYIQDNNQQRRGKDFRFRFIWRLCILFVIGQFNAAFFTGEILMMYALLGVILPLFCRLSDRTVAIVALVLILQPIDWVKVVWALCNPDYEAGKSLANHYFGIAYEVQKHGTFLETLRMNLWEGQMANMTWALEHGRIMQTPGLFLFGMLIGRRGLFLYNAQHEQIWLKTLAFSLLCFFPLYGLNNMLPEFVSRGALLAPLRVIVSSLSNLSFMLVMVSGLLITFYRIHDRSFLMRFTAYGKMSMTNYIGQSVIGSLLFYHWGFELGRYLGITYSLLFGIIFVLLQMAFCSWWMKHHKHGPFEGLWKRLTWIGKK